MIKKKEREEGVGERGRRMERGRKGRKMRKEGKREGG